MSTVSRRTIMQAAALVPFQAVRSSAQNSAMKIGIIGAGSRGILHRECDREGSTGEGRRDLRRRGRSVSNAKAKIGAPDAKPTRTIRMCSQAMSMQ